VVAGPHRRVAPAELELGEELVVEGEVPQLADVALLLVEPGLQADRALRPRAAVVRRRGRPRRADALHPGGRLAPEPEHERIGRAEQEEAPDRDHEEEDAAEEPGE
jgi:hypothetical protein